MRCAICKRNSEEVRLFNGILESDMVMVCEDCAEDRKIPIIRKPSVSQLDRANKRYTVRERMEIMSGMRDRTEISHDQIITQGNLARLRAPPKKQTHEDVLDNYYWTLSMARRRKKMTTNYLAQKMGVHPSVIQGIEKGILPNDFEPLFTKLEAYLGIKMLKTRRGVINFVRSNHEAEKEILESVRQKMNSSEEDFEEEDHNNDSNEEEDLDIKDKKTLSRITISDLINRKKKREAKEKKRKEQEDEDAMMGEDLDLEIEDLN